MPQPLRVLLTGASGFVGHHVLRHLLVNTDWEIVCPITLRHKGSSTRIGHAIAGHGVDALSAEFTVEHAVEGKPTFADLSGRVRIVHHDLAMPMSDDLLRSLGKVDVIMNVASESHVDRSIAESRPFVENNVALVLTVLEACRVLQPRLMLHMSTDEVYGPAPAGHLHAEGEAHRPSNPYSASKAAQEAIVYAYWRTHGVPAVITNTMNIFGEAQDPEKFMAKVMRAVARDEPVDVHAQRYPGQAGLSHFWKPGSRFYLHARNLADAWLFLANRYLSHESDPRWNSDRHDMDRYNIVGEQELANDAFATMIAEAMGKEPRLRYVDFHSSRPGHDLRYALDGTLLSELGWRAPVSLREGVRRTVEWTLGHPEWL